uniref:Uncharacterized protein n=1 Tax=Salix viminalis TaxID=40686 RepID=A0A6N2M370_SALVM
MPKKGAQSRPEISCSNLQTEIRRGIICKIEQRAITPLISVLSPAPIPLTLTTREHRKLADEELVDQKKYLEDSCKPKS